jgi:deoxyadenosine/deoxycytidine kinase
MAQIICIEGNIGSGKSTFVQFLKTYYKDRDDICFLDEPVDLWLTCKDDNGNILEHYYRDQKEYGFKFQMLAYISRLSILKKAYENKQYKYIISERSLFTDRNVFCKMLYDDKLIDEIGYQIYNMWFDEFNQFTKNTKYIYLRTLPQTSYERVVKRARKGESISLEYLTKCSQYHDNWLLNDLMNQDMVALFDANISEQDTHNWVKQLDQIIL